MPLSPDSRGVILITGPMAAGKTTIARALAERFDRGVHLEGDLFRDAIITGRAEMTPEASSEALGQLRLRYRLTAAAADEYLRAGFTTVVDDVAAGPLLEEFVAMFAARPLHVVVLLPSSATLREREAARTKRGYHSFSLDQLQRAFRDDTPRMGLWVDTSNMTVEQTVQHVLTASEPVR